MADETMTAEEDIPANTKPEDALQTMLTNCNKRIMALETSRDKHQTKVDEARKAIAAECKTRNRLMKALGMRITPPAKPKQPGQPATEAPAESTESGEQDG